MSFHLPLRFLLDCIQIGLVQRWAPNYRDTGDLATVLHGGLVVLKKGQISDNNITTSNSFRCIINVNGKTFEPGKVHVSTIKDFYILFTNKVNDSVIYGSLLEHADFVQKWLTGDISGWRVNFPIGKKFESTSKKCRNIGQIGPHHA